MDKIVKTRDMNRDTIAKVFCMLNSGLVKYSYLSDTGIKDNLPGVALVTDVEPKDLAYPEGWCYINGIFCNKNQNSSTSMYMVTSNGKFWADSAQYCAGDCN